LEEEFLSLDDRAFLRLCEHHNLSPSREEKSFVRRIVALGAALHAAHACSKEKGRGESSDKGVWNAGNLTVGILAAHSSQVIACQEAWKILVELLPEAARASFELCTVSIATSPGIQGKTLMHSVLCMPLNCADWTQFHVSPHRLCNFVSRHFHGLRFLQCHG